MTMSMLELTVPPSFPLLWAPASLVINTPPRTSSIYSSSYLLVSLTHTVTHSGSCKGHGSKGPEDATPERPSYGRSWPPGDRSPTRKRNHCHTHVHPHTEPIDLTQKYAYNQELKVRAKKWSETSLPEQIPVIFSQVF